MDKNIAASVVISTFNRKTRLKQALDSLLKQAHPHDKYEVIVVDDYSTDGTKGLVEEVARSADVKISYYANNKAKGHTVARNIGFQKARGEFIATTDDDVEVKEDWIAMGLSHFNSPDVSAVEGRTVSDGKRLPFYRDMSLNGGTFASCNMFYRKTVLQEVGGLNEELNRWLNFCSDYALAFEIRKRGGKIVYGEDVVVYHPSYKLGVLHILRYSLRLGAIPYHYRKYGYEIMPYLGLRLYRFVGGFLVLGLLVSVISSNYLAMLLSGIGLVFIIATRIPGFTKAGMRTQIKAILVYGASFLLSTAAFLFECFRFRVLPTKRMFRL